MELTLTMNNNLAKFLRLFDDPRRVFLAHFRQGCHHLLRLAFIDGLHSTRVFGIRIFNKVKFIVAILSVQRVTRLHILQLNGTTDVAGIQLVDSDTVSTSTGVDCADALLRAAVSICQVVARLDATAHHLKVAHLTNVGFNTCLEEVD